MVRNIRRNLWMTYKHHCAYKAGFLEPVDWRAREYNTGADFLVKFAMQTATSGGSLNSAVIQQWTPCAHALQFYSDGGYSPGHGGAYGVQLLAYTSEGCELVGRLYHYDLNAKSAFEMELRGLDAATRMLQSTCNNMSRAT